MARFFPYKQALGEDWLRAVGLKPSCSPSRTCGCTAPHEHTQFPSPHLLSASGHLHVREQCHGTGADPKPAGSIAQCSPDVSVLGSCGASQQFLEALMQQDAGGRAESPAWDRGRPMKGQKTAPSDPFPGELQSSTGGLMLETVFVLLRRRAV